MSALVAVILYFSGGKNKGDESYELLRVILPIYLPMSLSGFTRRLLISFVAEKEEKKQEYLFTLGLTRGGYLAGWMAHQYLLGLLASSLVILGAVLGHSSD